jgi:hypothetical protein
MVARSVPSARHSTDTQPATTLLVIHRLRPVTSKPSAVSVATVVIRSAVRSELVSGSVVANENAVRPLTSSGISWPRISWVAKVSV